MEVSIGSALLQLETLLGSAHQPGRERTLIVTPAASATWMLETFCRKERTDQPRLMEMEMESSLSFLLEKGSW